MRERESCELTEEDFYPPQDDRVLTSGFECFDEDCEFGYSDYEKWYYAEYGDDIFGDGWEN